MLLIHIIIWMKIDFRMGYLLIVRKRILIILTFVIVLHWKIGRLSWIVYLLQSVVSFMRRVFQEFSKDLVSNSLRWDNLKGLSHLFILMFWNIETWLIQAKQAWMFIILKVLMISFSKSLTLCLQWDTRLRDTCMDSSIEKQRNILLIRLSRH